MNRRNYIYAFIGIALSVAAILTASCEETKIEITETDYELRLSADTLHLKVGKSGGVKAEYVILKDGAVVSSEDVTDSPRLILKSLRDETAVAEGGVVTAISPGNAVVSIKYEKAHTSLIVAVTACEEENDAGKEEDSQEDTKDKLGLSLPETIDTLVFDNERITIPYEYTSPYGGLFGTMEVVDGKVWEFRNITDRDTRTGRLEIVPSSIPTTMKVVFTDVIVVDSVTLTLITRPHKIQAEGGRHLSAAPEGETLRLGYSTTLPDSELLVKASGSWVTAVIDPEARQVVVEAQPNKTPDARTAEITLCEASGRLSPAVWTLARNTSISPWKAACGSNARGLRWLR